MILCDMHVHSRSSHDSSASVLDTALACIEKGISAFAITDHCDIQYFVEHDVPTLIKASLDEIASTSEKLGERIKILKGIELGEGIWSKEHTEQILNSFDFDVVIGSVHAVRYKDYSAPYSTLDFSKMTPSELDEYMNMYFDEVLEMLRLVPCDILAHLTCPLRYINGKFALGVDTRKYESKIRKILKLIVDKEIALEVNTSGVGTSHASLMPDTWIIELFKQMGGELVTLGSDAHTPTRVGIGFDKAISLLRELGFERLYFYESRKRKASRLL
jgi:histidinol-phosphatase (PHP family)